MSEIDTSKNNTELPMDEPDYSSRMKNVKELKFANSVFTVDPNGKSEWRDTAGNVVILIDPNG